MVKHRWNLGYLRNLRCLGLVGHFDGEICYVRTKRVTGRARERQLSSQTILRLGEIPQSVTCRTLI